jgi:hypothetical protein
MKRLRMLKIPEFIAAVLGGMFCDRIREPLDWLVSDGWSYAMAKCHSLSLWIATPVTLAHGHVVAWVAGAVIISLTARLLFTRVPSRHSRRTVWIPVSRNHWEAFKFGVYIVRKGRSRAAGSPYENADGDVNPRRMKMKDLCSRARSAMNLVLLLVVFQLWVLLPSDSSKTQVERDLTNIYDSLGENPDANRLTQHFRDFRESYKRLHPEYDLEDVPLALVLNLEDKDLRLQQLPQPAPLSTPAPRPALKVETEKERLARRDDALLAPDTFTEGQLPFADPYATKLPSFDLRELKQWIREAELQPNATRIGDLERKLGKEVEVPFIKQRVAAAKAAWILSFAVLAPIALLFVLLDSLWLESRDIPPTKEKEVLDLVMLYRSGWAYFLGMLWLVAPVVLTGFGMSLYANDENWNLYKIGQMAVALLTGGVLVYLCWIRVIKIRKLALALASPASMTAAALIVSVPAAVVAAAPAAQGGEEEEDEQEDDE